MKLYHSGLYRLFYAVLLVALFALPGCTLPQATPSEIEVTVHADGETFLVSLPLDSTVQAALDVVGISLGDLDRVEPPVYSLLVSGSEVEVIRVREEIFEKEEIVPFERQTIRNETLPEGESRIVQVGVNGIEVVTWRRLYENDQEVSLQALRRVTRQEALPEILMVGSQSPFTSFSVPGRLAYLLGGSAWLIEEKTGSRRPIVTTGDLDGRIFSLSPDGRWLLFTRKSEDEEQINTLWAAEVNGDEADLLVDLEAANVVHFAEFNPADPRVIAYSTVEPRPSAPGWQANNDLHLIELAPNGNFKVLPVELESNSGGRYGWWGMDFAWAPDGELIAYARPDSVGLLEVGTEDTGEESLIPLLDTLPFQTGSDWAWVPGLTWGPDGNALFTVSHLPDSTSPSPEESQLFSLTAVPLTGGSSLPLVSQTGMFAYPLASPMTGSRSDEDYRLAYLHAIFPTQSETSRYQVYLVDRDGSNRTMLFPEEGVAGLEPNRHWGAWSPAPLEDTGSYALAVIYQNNLWIVDTETGTARQITGDNLVTRVDWK